MTRTATSTCSGRLATDRPHVVKVYGAYTFPFGTQIGAFFYAGSGTPISTYVTSVHTADVFVEGRGNFYELDGSVTRDKRTPALTRTDLLLSHAVDVAGNKRLRFDLNVQNLFNQKTTRHIFNFLNRGSGTERGSSLIDLTNTDLTKGYDYNALIRATPDGANAYEPRYGMADLFEDGTRALRRPSGSSSRTVGSRRFTVGGRRSLPVSYCDHVSYRLPLTPRLLPTAILPAYQSEPAAGVPLKST